MTKNLKKELMNRPRLRNKYLRNNSKENKLAYNKQRNICMCLLRKEIIF